MVSEVIFLAERIELGVLIETLDLQLQGIAWSRIGDGHGFGVEDGPVGNEDGFGKGGVGRFRKDLILMGDEGFGVGFDFLECGKRGSFFEFDLDVPSFGIGGSPSDEGEGVGILAGFGWIDYPVVNGDIFNDAVPRGRSFVFGPEGEFHGYPV